MTILLTRPPNRGAVATKVFGVSILAGNTEIIDSVAFVDHITAKWLVTVVDPTTTEVQSYHVTGNHISGGSVSYNVYGKIGDIIKNSPEVIVSGSNLVLQVTNNEGADTIEVDSLRYEVSA